MSNVHFAACDCDRCIGLRRRGVLRAVIKTGRALRDAMARAEHLDTSFEVSEALFRFSRALDEYDDGYDRAS